MNRGSRLKRSPLKASRKPMKRHAPLESRTPLAQMSVKRAAKLAAAGRKVASTLAPARWVPAVPADVRKALVARSGGQCEIGLAGCAGEGTQTSHRKTVKSGGRHGAAKVRHDRLSNLMDACTPCHDQVTDALVPVYVLGLALKEQQIPSRRWVLYRGERVFLCDCSDCDSKTPGVHDYEAGAA